MDGGQAGVTGALDTPTSLRQATAPPMTYVTAEPSEFINKARGGCSWQCSGLLLGLLQAVVGGPQSETKIKIHFHLYNESTLNSGTQNSFIFLSFQDIA